ncbi:hypothetical protein ACHAXR_009673 [Thalassiosira sp. AJA248-18]
MNTLLPTFILFIILVASITTTVVIENATIHSLEHNYQGDIAKVNDHLRAVQSQQSTYAHQVQTLSKLVKESLNATDEYIQNITDTVSETKDVISHDMATVQDIQDSQHFSMAVQFAGMFTILVILVSGYHLSQHLRHMHSPVVQRKIMAVLWMTPVYSLCSWLSLVFQNAEPYLAVIREFYESYCVYMFLSFLISVLGRGDRHVVVDLLEQRADQLNKPDKCRCGPKAWKRCWQSCCNKCGRRRRVPNDLSLAETVVGETSTASNNASSGPAMTNPTTTTSLGSMDGMGNFNYSPARQKAEAVLDQCQLYCMQFVLLRPVTAIGWLVSNQLVVPKYFLDPTTPQLYITILTNGSIFFAFRGLVRFYYATKSNLAWCNPWPKFLCIKGVVFMTFWQRMMLSLIVNIGYADKFNSQEDANNFIIQAQNFLICLEMLFSAVAHCFVFSPDEWTEGYRQREEERRRRVSSRAFGDSVALGDFISDVKVVMASKKRRKRQKRLQKAGLSPSSTMDDDEGNDIDLSLSRSSGGDSENGDNLLMSAPVPSNQSAGFVNVGEPLDPNFSNDEAEYVMELATAKSRPRPRLDTSSSVDSDGGEIGGSLARIEQFINSVSSEDQKEVV